jgi:hypothetical protein
MTQTKRRVIVAWMNTNYDPPRPAAVAWKSAVPEAKLAEIKLQAQHHAAREHTVHESALVLSFPMREKDPLAKARAKVLDVARGLGLAGKHEAGGNPRVSRSSRPSRSSRIARSHVYKPSKAWHLHIVDRVVPSHGAHRVEFQDGLSIQVHAGSGRSDLLYAMRPHDMRYQGRSPGPESRREYQYAALRAVLGAEPATFILDADGDIRAERAERTAGAQKHEAGGNPRVSRSARDMTLKARVNALVGRGKK